MGQFQPIWSGQTKSVKYLPNVWGDADKIWHIRLIIQSVDDSGRDKRPLHGATWGRIMWGLTNELRTLWPQRVYMAGVPACITDKSLDHYSCWPEIKMYWRQRPLLCVNMYTLCRHYYVKLKKNLKQNEKKLALVYKFCHCTLKLILQHLRETIFST